LLMPNEFKVPLSKPNVSDKEKELLSQVLDSGQLSMGPFIDQFERSFTKYIGTKYACAVSSGTSALHLALRLLDISSGDEIITTPYSFIASANCILFENARPVFADIESTRLGLDPDEVVRKITKKTKAVLAVHLMGKSCEIASLRALCDKYGIALIEDCCEALGTSFAGQTVGTFGEIATYGFYPNKHITTGEGGMLCFDNPQWRGKAMSLRNQGRDMEVGDQVFSQLGYNYRMSELNAALGVAQISSWLKNYSVRRELVQFYHKELSKIANLDFKPWLKKEDSPFFMPIFLKSEKMRDKIQKSLDDFGIQSKAYFSPPIHLQRFYREKFGYTSGNFPTAEKYSSRLLALPFYTSMSKKDIQLVCKRLGQAINDNKQLI